MAERQAIYLVVDCLCIAFLSLQTYCVIRFCLTSTFKVTSTGNYTSEGIPNYSSRIATLCLLVPSSIIIDTVMVSAFHSNFEFMNEHSIVLQTLFILMHISNTIFNQIAVGR